MSKKNGRAHSNGRAVNKARATDAAGMWPGSNVETVARALASGTPRDLLAVAQTLQKRSSEHAQVLHDSLYRVAVDGSAPRASRSGPKTVRKGLKAKKAGARLKARLRGRAAPRAVRRRSGRRSR